MCLGLLLLAVAGEASYTAENIYGGLGLTTKGMFAEPWIYDYGNFTGGISDFSFPSGSNTECFATQAIGGLYHTTTFDAPMPTWRHVQIDKTFSNQISSVHVLQTNPDVVVVASGITNTAPRPQDGSFVTGVAKSVDHGLTWKRIPVVSDSGVDIAQLVNFQSVKVLRNGNLIAACANGVSFGATAGYGHPQFVDTAGLYLSEDGGPLTRASNDQGQCFQLLVAEKNGDELLVGLFRDKIVSYEDSSRARSEELLAFPVGNPSRGKLAYQDISGEQTQTLFAVLLIDRTPVSPTVDIGGGLYVCEDPWSNLGCSLSRIVSDGIIFGQANVHGAFTADRDTPNLLYAMGTYSEAVSGRGQGNSGNIQRWQTDTNYRENIFRQAQTVHPDSKQLAVLPNGNLVLACDGGLFESPNPKSNTDSVIWKSKAGSNNALECVQGDYDPVSMIGVCAAQDNGCLVFNPSTAVDDVTGEAVFQPSASPFDTYGDKLGDGLSTCVLANAKGPDGKPVVVFSLYNLQLKQVDHKGNVIKDFGGLSPETWGQNLVVHHANDKFLVSQAYTDFIDFFDVDQTGVLVQERFNLGYHVHNAVYGHKTAPENVYLALADELVIYQRSSASQLTELSRQEYPNQIINPSIFALHPDDDGTYYLSPSRSIVQAGGPVVTVDLPRIQGNGALYNPGERSAVWVPLDTGFALLVGTQAGVFAKFFSGLPISFEEARLDWSVLRFGLPLVTVGELKLRGVNDDTLVLSTRGNGMYYIPAIAEALAALRDFRVTEAPVTARKSVARQGCFDVDPLKLYASDAAQVNTEPGSFVLKQMNNGALTDVSSMATVSADGLVISVDITSACVPTSTVFTLVIGPDSIIKKDDPTVYVSRGIERDSSGIANKFYASRFFVGDASAGPQPASAPSNVQLVSNQPLQLTLSWDKGIQGDCYFQIWKFTGFAYHDQQWLPTNMDFTDCDVYSLDSTTCIVPGLQWNVMYKFSIAQVCLDNTTTPEAESNSIFPRSPRSEGAQRVQVLQVGDDMWDISARSINFVWNIGDTYGCVFKAWEVLLSDASGTEFEPEGCKNLPESARECIATGLTPKTSYLVSITEKCTDPTLDSVGASLDSHSPNPPMLKTLAPCSEWKQGIISPSGYKCEFGAECENGRCEKVAVCNEACCNQQIGPACPVFSPCVCSFDPYCCSNKWDKQCVEEAKTECGLAC